MDPSKWLQVDARAYMESWKIQNGQRKTEAGQTLSTDASHSQDLPFNDSTLLVKE